MATGDSADIQRRVIKEIPRRWFAFGAQTRNAVIGGLSDLGAWCYSWITYARLQTRVRTAQFPWLDVASYDFLGPLLPRKNGETDASYSTRVIKEVLRPRNTRAAIIQLLTDLTGNPGTVKEPWNPGDWGAYGTQGQMGYGVAGGYGSLQFRNQILVTAVQVGQGIPNIAGYGTVYSGYGGGNGLGRYCDLSEVAGPVTNAQIYSRIAGIVSAGITAWVDIQDTGAGDVQTGLLTFEDPQTVALTAVLGGYW